GVEAEDRVHLAQRAPAGGVGRRGRGHVVALGQLAGHVRAPAVADEVQLRRRHPGQPQGAERPLGGRLDEVLAAVAAQAAGGPAGVARAADCVTDGSGSASAVTKYWYTTPGFRWAPASTKSVAGPW